MVSTRVAIDEELFTGMASSLLKLTLPPGCQSFNLRASSFHVNQQIFTNLYIIFMASQRDPVFYYESLT